jgi:hypothetical protein
MDHPLGPEIRVELRRPIHKGAVRIIRLEAHREGLLMKTTLSINITIKSYAYPRMRYQSFLVS